MQPAHGCLARHLRCVAAVDRTTARPYLTGQEDMNPDPKDRTMAHTTVQPLNIQACKLQAEADAVLEQMYGYFTRDEAPRVIETRRAA